MSLKLWDDLGISQRETKLYEIFHGNNVNVSFVTYGNSDDLRTKCDINNFKVLYNRFKIPQRLYESTTHLLHSHAFKSADVIKSNQTNGAEIALKVSKYFNKYFIARCGYMLSKFMEHQYGLKSVQYMKASIIENKVFSNADQIIVASKRMKDDINLKYPLVSTNIAIVPNYVDTNSFRPAAFNEPDYDIVFVGRIDPQKNVPALLEAAKSLRLKIILVGTGSENAIVRKYRNNFGNSMKWIKRIDNSQLPEIYNRGKIFVLPSHYEGHPKVIIEAMASGTTVMGSDSPGINEIIHHGFNGWLCGTDTESIKENISYLLGNSSLRSKLEKNARIDAIEKYSLEKISKQELKIIRNVVKK